MNDDLIFGLFGFIMMVAIWVVYLLIIAGSLYIIFRIFMWLMGMA